MYPVGETTVREIMDRRAREDPGHIYCYFKDRAYTFGEIDDAANRMANGLLDSGLESGERVALMLPSHPDHIISILALMKVGLVRIPVNVHLKGAALEYVFEQFEPHALIVDTAYEDQIKPVLQIRSIGVIVWRNGFANKDRSFHDFMMHANNAPPPSRPHTDDIVALTPSSGTTGSPKGVLKSDRVLRAAAMATSVLTKARKGDVFLFWEALHHGAGVNVIITAVIERITLAMVERFSASQFWADSRRHNATHIHYLGGVLPMLLRQPAKPEDKQQSVRIAWGGGCPIGVWRTFEERFGLKIHEGYGLSELTAFVTINTDGPVGSVGKPLPFFDIKIVDENGAEVLIGETGEITVRAREPGLGFLGYFRSPEASSAAMRGDWFCTGDLGRKDVEGNIYFEGRKKDMARRRGINISAWEVERVINEHEDIEECALVAVPSELGDDELLIYVKQVMGRNLNPLDLIRWCEPRMPYFQIPRYVGFVDEFPRTPTQRIQKMNLSRSVDGCWDLEKSGHRVIRKS